MRAPTYPTIWARMTYYFWSKNGLGPLEAAREAWGLTVKLRKDDKQLAKERRNSG